MNLLSPSTWPGVRRLYKSNEVSTSVIARASTSLGIWQDTLGGFVPREVNPYFYESLREALPILDGAVNRLVTLDGIVRVEGGNDALAQEIQNGLLASIPVNDNEGGLQAAYASQGNELYEQGIGAIEMVMDAKGRELIGLRVADSKGIAFDREPETLRLRSWYRPPSHSPTGRLDGTDQVEAVIRGNQRGTTSVANLLHNHNYVQLNSERMAWALLQPEADSPYGVSLFRSMEFVSQILLKIENATGQVWDRFGSPSFSLTYKTKNRVVAGDAAALLKRQKTLADGLSKVLDAKRKGNSADFVNAIAADDDIVIEIIGAQDQVLEIEKPARHLLEQIVGKTGVPAWLLGLQWTTAERLAQQQSEMVLQESRTRWERRHPGLRGIVETWLRGRGRTWKPGDWALVQELPSLHDELKRAQANFLNAQTELMRRGGNSGENAPPAIVGTDQGAAKRFRMLPDGSMEFTTFEPAAEIRTGKRAAVGAAKAAGDGEPWAESDPELPRIEARTIATMLADWSGLESDTLAALSLPATKAGEQVWTFTPDLRAMLDTLANEFELQAGSGDGGLMRGMLAAWRRGVENAAAEIDGAAALQEISADARATMQSRALDLARTVTTRTYRADIISELSEGAYNGLSPGDVAKRLRERFGAHDYDWERLARSEIAQAQVAGKEAEYAELGIEQYDYVTAGDSLVSAICRTNAAGGPYKVGAGKLPMRDSHPNCRCSIRARSDDEA